MNGTDDPWVSAADAAALMGWKNGTVWRSAVSSGYAPRPDDPDADRPPSRRMPRWRRSTVVNFRDSRPGQGARTDLRKEEG